jgi:hypothetical protein
LSRIKNYRSIRETILVAKKSARKKISEQLLIERLRLEEEWLDPDNICKDFPTRLPKSIRQQRSPAEIKDLKKALDQLSKRGCHMGVLYWCLNRLGPRADWLRRGGEEIPPLVEDSQTVSMPTEPRKLATREDMAHLIRQVKSTAKTIYRFRRELLLSADALGDDCPLPESFLGEGPSDSIDSLYLLRASLRWVLQLAEYWETPYEATLMKSKGILYLLAYVSIYADASASHPNERLHAKRSRAAKDSRILTSRDAETISQIAYLYCRMDLPPADLIAKLEAFQSDHAMPYARLVDKLAHVDGAARSLSA